VYTSPDNFEPIYTQIGEIEEKIYDFDERTEYIINDMTKVAKKVDKNLCKNCCHKVQQ
jgi:hypothetical protein